MVCVVCRRSTHQLIKRRTKSNAGAAREMRLRLVDCMEGLRKPQTFLACCFVDVESFSYSTTVIKIRIVEHYNISVYEHVGENWLRPVQRNILWPPIWMLFEDGCKQLPSRTWQISLGQWRWKEVLRHFSTEIKLLYGIFQITAHMSYELKQKLNNWHGWNVESRVKDENRKFSYNTSE